MYERSILHCDLNNFFASCECLKNPNLKKVPMVVAGSSEKRHGIVLAKNDMAKKYGIQTTDTIWQAKSKCRDIAIVLPDMDMYVKYSKIVKSIYCEYTDMVESFGIDECFLDVTHSKNLFGTGEEIAEILRKRVKSETGLTISVGVSFNMIFAKLGSDYKKPDAITVISKDNFRDFVRDMPIESLLFVGKEAQKRLYTMGLTTIGKVACENRMLLKKALGKIGEMIWDYSNGIDFQEVSKYYDKREQKSIGKGRTFSYDITDNNEIKSEIMSLCEDVSYNLKKANKKGNVVCLSLKSPLFVIKNKQKITEKPMCCAYTIYNEVIKLYNKYFYDFGPVRSITITVKNFIKCDNYEQISLFYDENKKSSDIEAIEDVMYKIKNKYGKNSITFGINKINSNNAQKK